MHEKRKPKMLQPSKNIPTSQQKLLLKKSIQYPPNHQYYQLNPQESRVWHKIGELKKPILI